MKKTLVILLTGTILCTFSMGAKAVYTPSFSGTLNCGFGNQSYSELFCSDTSLLSSRLTETENIMEKMKTELGGDMDAAAARRKALKEEIDNCPSVSDCSAQQAEYDNLLAKEAIYYQALGQRDTILAKLADPENVDIDYRKCRENEQSNDCKNRIRRGDYEDPYNQARIMQAYCNEHPEEDCDQELIDKINQGSDYSLIYGDAGYSGYKTAILDGVSGEGVDVLKRWSDTVDAVVRDQKGCKAGLTEEQKQKAARMAMSEVGEDAISLTDYWKSKACWFCEIEGLQPAKEAIKNYVLMYCTENDRKNEEIKKKAKEEREKANAERLKKLNQEAQAALDKMRTGADADLYKVYDVDKSGSEKETDVAPNGLDEKLDMKSGSSTN